MSSLLYPLFSCFSENVTHIFWKKDFVVTCYPENIENGWCTTRRMGNLIDTEPTYDAGWGFCSSGDPRFEKCNESIDQGAKDPSGKFNSRDFLLLFSVKNRQLRLEIFCSIPHNFQPKSILAHQIIDFRSQIGLKSPILAMKKKDKNSKGPENQNL